MIQISGNMVDLEQQLDAMALAAGDLTGAWPEVGKWWQARQRAVFATHNSGAWPLRDKGTKTGGRGVLIRSGALLRSVSNPKPVYSSPSTARFGQTGTDGWYGVFHQRGDSVPVRKPVPPLTETEAKEVVAILAKHIMEAK